MFAGHAASEFGMPTGSTGNEWDEGDFAGHDTPLAVAGGPEFVEFCVEQGTCEFDGAVLEKFKEIVNKYPISELDEDDFDEDYDAQDHFAVIVRNGLIAAGLIPAGDPERYQYKISMAFIHFVD